MVKVPVGFVFVPSPEVRCPLDPYTTSVGLYLPSKRGFSRPPSEQPRQFGVRRPTPALTSAPGCPGRRSIPLRNELAHSIMVWELGIVPWTCEWTCWYDVGSGGPRFFFGGWG